MGLGVRERASEAGMEWALEDVIGLSTECQQGEQKPDHRSDRPSARTRSSTLLTSVPEIARWTSQREEETRRWGRA